MTTKNLDVVALGSCYIDINSFDYPFDSKGIPSEVELVGSKYEMVAGSSAVNFCLLLQKMKLNTAFIGMAGTDVSGDTLIQLLSTKGVRPEIVRQGDLSTNISFNMTSPTGDHIMLVTGTANAALSPEVVIPKLDTALDSSKMLYMGGCFKLKAFVDGFDQIVDLAKTKSSDIVVDHGRIPAGTDSKMLEAVKRLIKGSRYYLPSREELCLLWGVDSPESGLQLLAKEAPELTVIIKDGQNGAWIWQDGRIEQVPSVKVEKVINLSGAGDSFNAGAIKALLDGQSVPKAASYACKVAAAKISGQPLE